MSYDRPGETVVLRARAEARLEVERRISAWQGPEDERLDRLPDDERQADEMDILLAAFADALLDEWQDRLNARLENVRL